MVGWKYRGTFPSLWAKSSSNDIDLTDLRERDAETKLSNKKYADNVRGAQDSDISVGDVVLLAHQKKHKTDPNFSSERYKVITRVGAKVVVMSKTGVQYARNVHDVKRAPGFDPTTVQANEKLLQHPDEIPDMALDASLTSSPVEIELIPQPESSGSSGIVPASTAEPRSLRRRNTIKRPSRFGDDFVYCVFH